MSNQYKGRKKIINEKRKKRQIIGGIILFISSASLLLVPLYIFNIITNIGTHLSYLFPLGIGFLLLSIGFISNPISDQENAFLEVVNAIEILENTNLDDELYNKAYQYTIGACESLEQMKIGESSWSKEVHKIKEEFTSNIRNRLAPAINDKQHVLPFLIEVATALETSDLENVEATSKKLESLNQIVIDKKGFNDVLKSALSKIHYKFIVSILVSTIIPIFTLFLICSVFQIDVSSTVKSNIMTFVGIIIALFSGTLFFLLKEY